MMKQRMRFILPFDFVLVRLAVLIASVFFAALLSVAPALAAGVPTISEQSALAGPQSAIVRAKIDSQGENASCHLEYATEAQYDASGYAEAITVPCTPETLEATSSGEQKVIVEVSGLTIDTGYDFRFIAVNVAHEEAQGADTTFATFGVEAFEVGLLDAEGNPFTQAGGHPYEYTTSIAINHSTETVSPSGNLKDVEVELPAGLVGDPAATPKCTSFQAESKQCKAETQVGTMLVGFGEEGGNENRIVSPLFNVVPPEGAAAELSARFNEFTNAFIEAHVRTGGDYGVDADSLNVTTLADVRRVIVTLWGVPGEAGHDSHRVCPYPSGPGVFDYEEPCTREPSPSTMAPFLSNPTSCTGRELTETARADTYQAPSEYVERTTGLPAVTDCGKVEFSPTIAVTPEGTSTDSPTGLHVDLHVPQNEQPDSLATADLKDASVTLPAGITVNPAEAGGVVGCQLLTGKEAHAGQEGIDLENSEAANCPEASKIGKVELDTPLIEHPLPGAIYLAQQGNAGSSHGSNPFGSLLAMYIVIDDPETGVVVKLGGQISADSETGQLTTTFNENPQLPFEDLKLDFFGGERAPLATPMGCGSYTTTSLLEPWSHIAPGETGTPDASPSSEFKITSAAGGGACAAPGFAPSLVAGTTNNQAGAFTPLTTIIRRKDGEQSLKSVSVTLPKGLAGLISQVPQCGEAQADAGTCSAASQIGNVTVDAGVGDEPLTLPEAGRQEDPVYLTGPFEGAPFGLSIVVHPEAGPFDLEEGGHPVVVRAKIEVNPHTAQVTVSTPASGPYSMPTILQGIPVDVQAIDVTVDREGFIRNPTSCEPMSVTGTIGSAEGSSAGVSSRFQAAGCRSLPFKPSFTVSTPGKVSRRGGAALKVLVVPPDEGASSSGSGEANLHEVKVTLPKLLPSRLSTLNKACLAKTFEENPANCPSESDVGTAIAHTPILNSPLMGPAYFVSHGGAAFPNLDVVLQGEGVTIELVGETHISKAGITTSTFATIPDAPITSFELSLPEGPYSALAAPAAGGSLCGHKLEMATRMVGQNGAVDEQETKIAVAGCAPALYLKSKKLSGKTARLKVEVPAAGKIKASGKGLSSQSKKPGKEKIVSLAVKLTKAQSAKLSKGKQVKAKIKLAFTPKKSGKKLTKTVTVMFKPAKKTGGKKTGKAKKKK